LSIDITSFEFRFLRNLSAQNRRIDAIAFSPSRAYLRTNALDHCQAFLSEASAPVFAEAFWIKSFLATPAYEVFGLPI
jgi:hypothetical protein